MSTSGVPFFDANGVQLGVRGGDVDISQQIIQNKAVEQQNKTLRQLAWIQSHELRAPLANIIGLANLLKNDFHDHGIKMETLIYLEREAERLDRTIRTIVEKAHQAETPLELRNKRRKKRPKTNR
jgi:light-regulated signal transduction histidine kinase (bacteriophytochrome)